jgi:aminopeptidase N
MRLALAVILLTACGGSDDKLPTGPIAAQVTEYDVAFDLDSRAAVAKVTATVTEGGDCWTLPFRGGAPTKVLLDGKPAEATQDATSITACGTGFDTKKPLVLEVDHTIPLTTLTVTDVGFTTKTDTASHPYDYLLSWVNECDRFMPCDNRADQFAHFHYDVTHAAGTVVRCPGTVADPSATETTCNFDFDGGPVYSTGVIAATNWTQADLGTWAGVHVTVYDDGASGVTAAIDPAYHTGYLTWMQSLLGPWPYGNELRVLTAPTYWDGFEHPGNIVLFDKLAATNRNGAYKKPVEHILDHEMAHMWAGDQTTLSGTYDFAWKESMAEYFAYVYEDMMDPAVAPATVGYWKNASAAAIYYPVPADKPALVDYYGDAYGPGPMVLFRQLEVLTSRDQVLAAIKSVLGHQHTISVDDVVAALAQSTGLDLTAYSAAWIHGSGKPAWPTVQLMYANGSLHVVQATSTDKRCKFHVALDGDQAGQQTLVEVDTFRNGVDQTLAVTPPSYAVTSVVLDPLGECLVYGAAFVAPRRFNPWVAQSSENL